MDKWECIPGGDPAPSSGISCEGATNSFKYVLAIRDGTEPPPDAMYVVVDGVEVPENSAPLPWYQHSVLNENYPFPVPAGFSVGQGVAQARNLDSVSHRLEVKSRSDDLLIFMYDNPTVVELDNAHKHVGTCLSAASQNGRDDATSTIHLYDQQFLRGNVQVEIGSVSALYEWSGNDVGFLEWFNMHFFDYAQITDAISDDVNYAFTFESKATTDILVKMTTMTNGTLINQDVEVENGNKSFSQIGKVATFWLTPKEQQISMFNVVYDNANGDVVISGKTLLPNQSVFINVVLVDFVDDKITISSDASGNFNLRVQTFKSGGIYHVYANVLDSNENYSAQVDVKSAADYLVPPTLSVTGVKTFNANPNGENYVKQDIYYANGMTFNTLNIFDIAQFWTALDGFSNGDFTLPGNSGDKICIAALKVFPQYSDPILIDIIEYIVP